MGVILGIVFFLIELIFGCHCHHWSLNHWNEWRCSQPAYNCEFINGYHWTQPGVALDCTLGCGPT